MQTRVQTYKVTLSLTVATNGDPQEWDWAALLDLDGSMESVSVIDVSEPVESYVEVDDD